MIVASHFWLTFFYKTAWAVTRKAITEWSSKAEVAQFNDARFGDENVLRFHIAVNTLNNNIKYYINVSICIQSQVNFVLFSLLIL